MKKKRYILFLLCLFSCKLLFADFFCKVKDFYPSEGFFQTLVSQYVQDDKGFIWLGTWNGLVRYDGYTFHEFRKVLTTNSILPNSRIVAIQKSATGNLFCTTNDNRLYFFDMKTNCFIDVFLQINFNKKEVIKNLFSLKDGYTWAIFADGSCLRLQDDSYTANHNYYKASLFCAGAKVIKNVVQDNYKNEWIITDNGISIFNRHIRFPNISVEAFHFSSRYACMAMTNGRLAVYSYKGNKIHFVLLPEKPATFYQMKSYRENIIMATDKGVIVYNQNNKAFRVYHLNSPNNPSDDALKVFTDSSDRIWVIPKLSGVYCIDLAHNTCDWFMSTPSKPMKYKLNAGFVYEEKDGNIIVKPNGGVLAYYDSNAHKLRDCTFYNEDGTMSYDPTILSYQFDNYGNLWLIQPQCLSCVSFIPKKFMYYTDKEKSITRALFIDPMKRLWVGDKDGAVYLLDQQHNIISYLNSKGTFQSSITHVVQNNVYCIYQDDRHRIWIGTKGCGLYLLTPKDNSYSSFKIQHFSSDKLKAYSLNSDDIYCIYQDNMHNVWIGTFGKGINLAREDRNGNFYFFNCDNNFRDYPRNDFSKVRCISQWYGGTMLVGTDNGLLTFNLHNLNNPKFYRNTFNQNSEKSLKGDAVMSIIHVGKRIFLGTFGCGLCEIMSHNLLSNQIQFTTYLTPQNTSANLINTAVCDNSSNIWLSSDYYIAQFSTKDNSYKIYDQTQFGSRIKMTEAKPVVSPNNDIAVGTDEGILFFNANHVSTDDKKPHIVFTGIQYQGDKYIKPINDLDKLTLSPSQRNISLYFSTMDFTYKSNEIHYAYRLKGLDDKWSYTGESHSVNYNNLPPGKFVLQISSCNSVGVWFSNTRSLAIYVTPRFCETIWCKLLYIILLLFVIAGIIYTVIYIYHLHHQAYLEQKISDVKINLFTDVSHELRTPLSLICGPIDEMMKEKNLPDSINNNLELVQKNALRLSQLVNHIFDFRKTPTETDKLIVEREDIVKHLHQIIRQFEGVTMWHINIELVSQNNQSFLWVDKGKFEKIIFNLISEVCKYPIEKSVKIEIKEDEDICTISIINEYVKSDNKICGLIDYVGRSVFFKFKSISEHNGSNMQNLLHLHGAELVDNHVGSDNISFALIFKKGYKHLANQPYVNLIMDTVDRDSADEPLSEELTDESNDDRVSILIVEDNYDLRMFLFSILRKDYRVLQASNGEEGLKTAQTEVPDFIITDVTMPVMDGMEMVRRIKSDMSICHIPIIVLSAKASLNDCVTGFKNGVDDYIVKPFSLSYLKSRIANIINQRRMLQQTYYQQFLSDQTGSSKIDINLKEPEAVDYNRDFMNKFIEYFQENISNSQLTIDDFAAYMNMSHSTFYNKVKAIVGVTPVDFIRQLRIKRATQMFEAGETSIQHVAYLSGFTDPHYFSKCFRSEMNCTPSEYMAKCKK